MLVAVASTVRGQENHPAVTMPNLTLFREN